MSNWIWSVKDDVSGAPIEGAAIVANVGTTPCPQVFGVNTGNCTSGTGYQITGNTNSAGQLVSTIQFTCPQNINYTVTAVGFNATFDQYASGNIDGDVNLPTVSMTPIANVPQTNQGGGATTTAASQGLKETAATPVSTSDSYVILAVLVVVFLLIGFFVYSRSKK
jgi:hypothetical protein